MYIYGRTNVVQWKKKQLKAATSGDKKSQAAQIELEKKILHLPAKKIFFGLFFKG